MDERVASVAPPTSGMAGSKRPISFRSLALSGQQQRLEAGAVGGSDQLCSCCLGIVGYRPRRMPEPIIRYWSAARIIQPPWQARKQDLKSLCWTARSSSGNGCRIPKGNVGQASVLPQRRAVSGEDRRHERHITRPIDAEINQKISRSLLPSHLASGAKMGGDGRGLQPSKHIHT